MLHDWAQTSRSPLEAKPVVSHGWPQATGKESSLVRCNENCDSMNEVTIYRQSLHDRYRIRCKAIDIQNRAGRKNDVNQATLCVTSQTKSTMSPSILRVELNASQVHTSKSCQKHLCWSSGNHLLVTQCHPLPGAEASWALQTSVERQPDIR